MILTYQYRLKDSGSVSVRLQKMARAVNFVWNYCNETSIKAVRYRSEWLSEYDLNYLTTGSSKELGIHSGTIHSIAAEYTTRRRQFKKFKLKWRGKQSLGWVPFKSSGIKVENDTVRYLGHRFKFWKSRDLTGRIKAGCFSQDARGRWYVNFQCEIEEQPRLGTKIIGVDLGCKDQLTCSDGIKYSRVNLTKHYEEKLAKAQRARRIKQVRTIHAKIANTRNDWAHKVTTALVKSSSEITVGNIESKKLMRTKMAKSISDAGFAQIKSMLAYKAIRHHVDYKEVNESGTTVTCSSCHSMTGPSGLGGLSVREWVCSSCNIRHDRDVNAARNILRLGHQTPIGNPSLNVQKSARRKRRMPTRSIGSKKIPKEEPQTKAEEL